jgi:hypothetical protein
MLLDYPDAELREAMAWRMLMSFFNSSDKAGNVHRDIKTALLNRDCQVFVDQINILLGSNPFIRHSPIPPNHAIYRSSIYAFFYALGIDAQVEKAGNLGKSDLILTYGGQTWVIEFKVNFRKTRDQKLAEAALDQILTKNYGGAYENPVLLGLAFGYEAREVTAWAARDGSSRLR